MNLEGEISSSHLVVCQFFFFFIFFSFWSFPPGCRGNGGEDKRKGHLVKGLAETSFTFVNPTNIGIVRGTVSVAIIVVVSAGVDI